MDDEYEENGLCANSAGIRTVCDNEAGKNWKIKKVCKTLMFSSLCSSLYCYSIRFTKLVAGLSVMYKNLVFMYDNYQGLLC